MERKLSALWMARSLDRRTQNDPLPVIESRHAFNRGTRCRRNATLSAARHEVTVFPAERSSGPRVRTTATMPSSLRGRSRLQGRDFSLREAQFNRRATPRNRAGRYGHWGDLVQAHTKASGTTEVFVMTEKR